MSSRISPCIRWWLILLLGLAISGCSEEKRLSIAEIGNVGSISGKHGVHDLYIQTVGGGWRGFNYGAVSGYPGASADIGGMGIPIHIKGAWFQGWGEESSLIHHYIDAPIDAALAEKKINTLFNYYQNYKRHYGSIQVIVEGARVQIMVTLACVDRTSDCTPKSDADPNGWVVKSPREIFDVVILFDGVGLTSKTAFPKVKLYE